MTVLLKRSNISVETNDDDTILLEICKRHQAIIDVDRKVVQDYRFDLTNDKLTYKYVQEWFLQEFRYFPL